MQKFWEPFSKKLNSIKYDLSTHIYPMYVVMLQMTEKEVFIDD